MERRLTMKNFHRVMRDEGPSLFEFRTQASASCRCRHPHRLLPCRRIFHLQLCSGQEKAAWPDGRRAGSVDHRLVSGIDLTVNLLGLAGDQGVTMEDPLDIYRGYWGKLPDEPDTTRTRIQKT